MKWFKYIYSYLRNFYDKHFPFQCLSENEMDIYYVFRRNLRTFLTYNTAHLVEPIKTSHYRNTWWHHEEYIFYYDKPCTIEPLQGWAINEDGKLIPQSIAYAKDVDTPHPSHFNFRYKPKQIRYENKIISIRMIEGGWNNYFHFINDIIGQILTIQNYAYLAGIPVAIPEELYNKNFFQDLLYISPFLKTIKIIVQSNFHIHAKESYFIKVIPMYKPTLELVINELKLIIPTPTKNTNIYIKRSTNIIRHLVNDVEIEEILIRYGFEIIESEKKSLAEQIQIFANARYVIGIHGAGLTNIIFRKNLKLSLLEIFPEDFVPPQYFCLSNCYGYSYDAVCGTKIINGSFFLSPEILINKITNFLENNY